MTANVQVHPIFVLSIVDTLLSILWMCGAVVWLKGGVRKHRNLRVGCFTITCMTVVSHLTKMLEQIYEHMQILQCVAMNVTLIYSLLAYSSIKQRDFSGVYVSLQCIYFRIPNSIVVVYPIQNIIPTSWNVVLSVMLCVQMFQQRSSSVHVWPPLCSFTAYFIAW